MIIDKIKRPKKNYFRVVVEIDEDEVDTACIYFEAIKKSIEHDKTVPSAWLKKFYRYLYLDYNYNEKQIQVQEISAAVCARFLGTEYEKEYFSDRFKKLIHLVVSQIIFSPEIPKTKDTFIDFVYELIVEWNPRFRWGKEPVSNYKVYVMTAVIVSNFGFKLTEKKNPTNEQLFQAVRNAIQKVNKKQGK